VYLCAQRIYGVIDLPGVLLDIVEFTGPAIEKKGYAGAMHRLCISLESQDEEAYDISNGKAHIFNAKIDVPIEQKNINRQTAQKPAVLPPVALLLAGIWLNVP